MLKEITVASALAVFGSGLVLVVDQQTQTENVPASSRVLMVAQDREEHYWAASRSAARSAKIKENSVRRSASGGGKKTRVVKKSVSIPSVASEKGSNRKIGKRMAAARGWTGSQWVCLERLWTKESNWETNNSYGDAYGIPQSLPGSKMKSAGADWKTNPRTQIKWGLGYIKNRHQTPCGAWAHFRANNWY